MNILRQILCLKIITIIALATLFISTMSIREAQAFHGVKCPCPLIKTFLVQVKLAKAFGVFNRDDLVCEKTAVGAALEQSTSTCVYFIASNSPFAGADRCEAEATSGCGYTMSYFIDSLTTDELAACRKQILITARLLGIPCQ